MRTCGNCEFNDGIVYTSCPVQYKCTITNEYHWARDICRIDFAPIVRCKDCINWVADEVSEKLKDDVRYCVILDTYPDPGWFCAEGERRRNADN